MKKIICGIIICFFITAGVCFAQESVEVEPPVAQQIADLLDSSLFKNSNQISELSKSLTTQQKKMIYEEYEKRTTMPFVLNLVVGLGIGSYVQGDIVTGIISSVVDSISGLLFIMSANILATTDEDLTINQKILFFSGAVWIASRSFECSRVFSYAKKHNKELNRALRMYENDVAILPLPVIKKDGSMELAVVMNIAL